MKRVYRHFTLWIIGLLLLATVGVLFSKLYYDLYMQGQNPFVITMPVRFGGLAKVPTEAGRIEPRKRVDLAFGSGGQVAEVLVAVGDTVGEGELLARLVNDRIQLGLERAELHARAAAVGESVSRQQAADLEYRMVLAEAAMTEIRAPFDGTVLALDFVRGQTVNAGQPGIAFADVTDLYVRTILSESRLENVITGLDAEITVRAYPHLDVSGTLIEIAPEALTHDGRASVDLLIRIEDTPAQLVPGLSVQTELLVPRAAGEMELAAWFIVFLFVIMLVATWALSRALIPEFANQDEDKKQP